MYENAIMKSSILYTNLKHFKNKKDWGGGYREMTWWIKALAAKPDSLSSSPQAHMTERENLPLQTIL